MISLWGGNKNKKLLTLIQKPSPYNNMLMPNSTRNSNKNIVINPICINQTIKRSSLFATFLEKTKAGMTVEAALVLPLCVMFLLNLGSAVEMIRLHNNLQIALWNTGREMAVYGYEQESNFFLSLLSAVYVKNCLVDYLDEEYLNQSMIEHGVGGLQLWESEMFTNQDELDLTLTYAVKPIMPLIGFQPFRMANKYYVHLWNGYEISENVESCELVYVTEYGEVWHQDRMCTYLCLSVSQIAANHLPGEKNVWGNRYSPCERCAIGKMPDSLFITEEGNCYHYRQDCPGIKRTVCAISKEEAVHKGYNSCSRCGE